MNVYQALLTIVGSIVGSSATFGFIQFLIQRKDKKEEDKKNDAFDALRKEFQKGLQDREDTGKARYDEHRDAINKMSIEHEKDFKTLLEAIKTLENNDSKITKALTEIQNQNENIGNAVMGLAHDKLIFSTDKIAERKAITLREKAVLRSIYEPYHKLGGNGTGTEAFEHVMSLEVVSEDVAKQMDEEIKNRKK